MINLMSGDCLQRMKEIPDGSVDMVLADPPYGTTQNKWDSVIPFDFLWPELMRIRKDRAAVVMTASLPFTCTMISSNMNEYKYNWVWDKGIATGHLNAKRMPMKQHEDVVVFCNHDYHPQGLKPHGKMVRRGGNGGNFGDSGKENFQEFTNYPRSILQFGNDKGRIHPTQKPVALMEYLIKTYTNEGETVLDFTMGSGTTGVACVNTGRKFIGIEMDDKYFEIARNRIESAQQSRLI